MVTKVALPTQPSVTPRRGTLLDAATVVNDFVWIDGVEPLWLSYNALKFQQSATFCGPNSKDLDQQAAWTSGFRFAVYGGLTCQAIGLDQSEMESSAVEAFDSGETVGVERALMETRFVADSEVYAGDPLDRWDAPADITPAGGAVSVKVGIAMLESWIANNYVGMGTLHIPMTVASLILGVDGAVFEGDVLRTKLGSKIAAGAGYDYPNTGPTGAAAAAGEAWLYVSGEVLVGKGETIPKKAHDYSTNDVFMLVERAYIVAVDGPVAAIRVKVE